MFSIMLVSCIIVVCFFIVRVPTNLKDSGSAFVMAQELPFDRDNADRDDFRTILASFIGRISQMTLV